MIETSYNPTFKCNDCGGTWRTSPIHIVHTPDLVLPPCPGCGGTLVILSFLASFLADFETDEPVYDAGIHAAFKQDIDKAYRQVMARELDSLGIQRKPT